jgi:hypothetical protein
MVEEALEMLNPSLFSGIVSGEGVQSLRQLLGLGAAADIGPQELWVSGKQIAAFAAERRVNRSLQFAGQEQDLQRVHVPFFGLVALRCGLDRVGSDGREGCDQRQDRRKDDQPDAPLRIVEDFAEPQRTTFLTSGS